MFASVHWYDWAGLVGVALTLLAYFLLQAGRARGDALPYQLMNAFGAFAVLLSLLYAFNLSAFVLAGLRPTRTPFAPDSYGFGR